MSRIARNNFNTSFFHVMVQGVNKEYIFNKHQYIKKYLQLIKKYEENYSINVLAYCIMNNHAHLLIYTEDITQMAKFMHKVNGIYAQHYNKNENRVGVVFRNRYVSQPIYDERYLIQCIKYIHMNPVKAGIVEKCEEYIYSTCKEYFQNTGAAKSKILRDVFGDVNYLELFNSINEEMVFEDTDVKKEDLIEEAIIKFEKKNRKNLGYILSNRECFIELIDFLRLNYRITYEDIRKKFGLTKSKINTLKYNLKICDALNETTKK